MVLPDGEVGVPLSDESGSPKKGVGPPGGGSGPQKGAGNPTGDESGHQKKDEDRHMLPPYTNAPRIFFWGVPFRML